MKSQYDCVTNALMCYSHTADVVALSYFYFTSLYRLK
ncbi:formate dehydrogenase [Kingella kingae]|nr:formate dehydrogenase [Kingella kingae]